MLPLRDTGSSAELAVFGMAQTLDLHPYVRGEGQRRIVAVNLVHTRLLPSLLWYHLFMGDLSLTCYICGADIAGSFVLTSERESTDRPFAVHDDCADALSDDASQVSVTILELA